MGFEDYGKQEFVHEYQRKLEKNDLKKKIKKRLITGTAVLASFGIPIGAVLISEMISGSREDKPETSEVSKEPKKSFEVARPERKETVKAKKKEIPTGGGEPPEPDFETKGSEFIQNLIDQRYDELNGKADFKITFEINDENGEVREMIERIGLTYGDPDHLDLYKAIAAKESRYKWEHSDDGGVGYFQITNIPPSIEKEVAKITERDMLTKEEANALAGIKTFERSLEYVRNQREQLGKEPSKMEEILLALWSYNIGPKHLDFSLSFEENYQRFKEGHRDYAPDVMAFNEASGEKGYRR